MLTYYGVYKDLDALGVVIFSVLFIVGATVALFIKKRKAQSAVLMAFTDVLLLLEAGILLPPPRIFNGDGYAITRDISLILAMYFAPVAVGVIVCFAFKYLIFYIKIKR